MGAIGFGDRMMRGGFPDVFAAPDMHAHSIRQPELQRAAQLRATTGLKPPDAIHAATAFEQGRTVFATDDDVFRRVSALAVTILADLLAS
jgi:predicted nucleic acid-binding protein